MKTRTIDISKYKWLEKDKKIWVQSLPDGNTQKQMFEQAIVKEINQQKHIITITVKQGKTQDVNLERCLKCTYGPSDVSDMVDLEQLNQPQLLWNIKRRYTNDLIFTLCGPTLLIINPYRMIQQLFTDEILHDHQALAFSEALQYKSQKPHIYGLAGFCLWQLFDNNRNQSIVISGQSGAGKTQNTKYCLKFLASMGKNKEQIRKRIENQQIRKIFPRRRNANNEKLEGIQDKILGCNQILQAFGNAKTIRNDNSSRFGKLIILLYGATKIDIKSAFITNYLLQKSRIVSISKKQRNYHIFYFFCKGCSQQQRMKYKLTLPIQKYYFLNQSDEYQAGNIDDKSMFERLKVQFQLYLTTQEIQCVLSIVSAVLNLGNVQFLIRQNQKKQQYIVINGQQYVKNVAQLINIDYEEFSRSLQFKKRIFRSEVTQSPFRLDQAVAMRDSFAKNLYEKLFNFLVFKLNQKIQLQKIDLEDIQNRSTRKSIGILDIFGFQILNTNSLEQFFINFANQKLQQLYVSYIFKEEQNEFNRQGLEKFSYEFDFADNKPIIQMIENYPEGIMHLVNEASQLNKSDVSLPDTITKKHQNNYVSIPKFKTQFFLINHSCSPVQYCSKGFIAKNKDQFPLQMVEIINKINNENMKNIVTFDSDRGKSLAGTGKKFLATKFLKQINNLVQQLYSSDCHFVRCIKPNQVKRPKVFNSQQVLQSLRNLGVLDSIRIRKLGYVYRRPFKQFCNKFSQLQFYNFNSKQAIQNKSQDELKDMVKRIVRKYASKDLQLNHILIGHNKILINQESINNFESQARQKRRLRINVANRLKTAFKKHVFRQKVNSFIFKKNILRDKAQIFKNQVRSQIIIKKVIKIQTAICKFLTKIRYKKIEAEASVSVCIITPWWRMVRNRRKFFKTKQNIINVQSHIRTYLACLLNFRQRLVRQQIKNIIDISWLQIQNKKAIMIQKTFRGYSTRQKFKQLIKQIQKAKQEAIMRMRATTIQKWWRYKLFKKNMNRYVLAAQKIQATFKAHILHKIYKNVQKSIKIMQNVVKKHLAQKYKIGKLWNSSVSSLKQFEQQRIKQLSEVGITIKPTKNILKITLDPATVKTQVASPVDTQLHFLGNQIPNLYTPVSLSNFYIHQDKNDFQSCILDIDIISSLKDFYQQKWGQLYKTIIETMKQKLQYPIKIEVSNNFTCVVSQKGKVYQFGQVHSTDNKQFNIIDKGTPFKLICTQYQGYLLNTNRQLYTWGDNDCDQLMKGYQSSPCSFEQNKYIPMQRIDSIQVKGQNKYLLCFGRVYEYSSSNLSISNTTNFKLTKQIMFPSKVLIRQMVASFNFIHFITTTGQLFSKGQNQKGQLGLGHTQTVNEPQLNNFFKNNKQIIDTISVGFKHTICKTRLGYVYAWGDNNYKQVYNQSIPYYSEPQKIEVQKASKAHGAVAGFRCSCVLLQNSKLYYWGTNSSLSKSSFQRLDFQKIYQISNNSCPLLPLKLCSTWSQNMSIIYINALNLQKCKKTVSKQNILKTIRNLSKQWSIQRIFPPYSEITESNLNLTDLKKYKFKQFGLRPSIHEQSIKNPFKQIDILINSKGQTGEVSSLNMSAKQKLEQMFKILLQKKQDQQWTEEERKLFSYLQNPKIQKLIKKL